MPHIKNWTYDEKRDGTFAKDAAGGKKALIASRRDYNSKK